MDSGDSQYCAKDLRKYLYLTGLIALFLVMGSYWYSEYYTKGSGLGLSSNSGVFAPEQVNAAGGVPVAMVNPITVAGKSPFAAVASSLKYSVVNVSAIQGGKPLAPVNPAVAEQGAQFVDPFAGAGMESIGSGVILSQDGYILTNYHVVEKASSVQVKVFNRQGSKQYPAEIIQLGQNVDLALIKIIPDAPLVPAALGVGRRNMISVGDPVLAIGSPFGLDQTVSKGIVSSLRKSVSIGGVNHTNLIQTDAAINQGNSGGPLVDINGYVIGINTAIYTPNGAFVGVGFAVPARVAKEFVEDFVRVSNVRPNLKIGRGQMLQVALPGVPVIQAGVPSPHGDRGKCTNCHEILPSGQTGVGQTAVNVPIALANGNSFAVGPGFASGVNVAFTGFGNRSASGQAASGVSWFGAEVTPLTRSVAQNFSYPYEDGVFINSIYASSPASAAGLQIGDIIFKVDGRWVRSSTELMSMVAGYATGDSVRVSIVRAGKKQNLYINIGKKPDVVTPALARPAMRVPAGQPQPAPPALAQFMQPSVTPNLIPPEFNWLGMELDPIDQKVITEHPGAAGKRGAMIAELAPNSPAWLAGLQPVDIIISINRMPVGTPAALNNAINATNQRDGVLLDVDRNGQRMYAVIR